MKIISRSIQHHARIHAANAMGVPGPSRPVPGANRSPTLGGRSFDITIGLPTRRVRHDVGILGSVSGLWAARTSYCVRPGDDGTREPEVVRAFGGGGISGTAGFFDQIGIVPGIFWATVVAVVETFGGLLVFVGLLTRVSGALIAIDMFVAMVSVHLPNGFFLAKQGIEFTLVLFAMGAALAVIGPGALAADAIVKRR